MGFFSGLAEGWELFKSSVSFLFKKPIFLIPLFLAWIVVAGITLYIRYYFTPSTTPGMTLFFAFLLIFLITLTICGANIIMLELMQQMEFDGKTSIGKAMKKALLGDLWKAIPVALVWAIVWFLILIAQSLTRKKNGNNPKPEPSVQDAAMALGGADSGPFSWLKLGLNMFEKLVRMYIFLTLPAIAWEGKGPIEAFGRSLEILKKHPMQFLTTYTLTAAATTAMAIPIIIVIYMSKYGTKFSPEFWVGVIIYEGIVWTLSIYLEQMSVGLLYLWHLKWVKKGSKGELSKVPKPDLLDNVYELR